MMLENVFRTMTVIKQITFFICLTILLPMNLVASELSKSSLASKTESVADEERIARNKVLLPLSHKTASVPPSSTAPVSPTTSMPTELAQGSSQEDSEIVTLSESESEIGTQIARVKNFSQQAGPVNLLLGAVNTKAIPGEWVFLDHEAGGSDGAKHDRTSEGRPYIIGSFNDLDLLEKLAANLESCFDTILLDDSTFKFTDWNIQKLACFAKMLKPGGAFIFCPLPGLSQILEQEDYQKQFNDRKSAISRVASGGVTENDYLETSSAKIESIKAENPY